MSKFFVVLGVAVAALAGCSSWNEMDRGEKIGTVGGAAIGGAVGSAATGGSTIGTVGGAAAGGILGNEVGERYDERNRRR